MLLMVSGSISSSLELGSEESTYPIGDASIGEEIPFLLIWEVFDKVAEFGTLNLILNSGEDNEDCSICKLATVAMGTDIIYCLRRPLVALCSQYEITGSFAKCE